MRRYHLTVLHTPRCLGSLSLRWGSGAGPQVPGDLTPAYQAGEAGTLQTVLSPPAPCSSCPPLTLVVFRRVSYGFVVCAHLIHRILVLVDQKMPLPRISPTFALSPKHAIRIGQCRMHGSSKFVVSG